jgi:adenosylcobinamide-GDP ribazoletransferase
VAALAQLATLNHWACIPLPFILSRMVMVLLAVTLPYARPEGGTGAVFVNNSRSAHFITACMLALSMCLLLAGIAGGVVFLSAFGLGYALANWMKIRFGGVTGDLLGMANETIECVVLFVLAAGMPYLKLIHGFRL